MFSRGALGVFAVVVAEYLVFGLAADLVGGSTVIWVSLAAFVAGTLLLRRHVPAMFLGHDTAEHGLLSLAGLLLFVPGLLTGLAGLGLLLPPVRNRVRSKARQRVETLVRRGSAGSGRFNLSFADLGRRPYGDVIDVDARSNRNSPGDTVTEDTPQSAPRELD
jgi:UPF0716 family protein affecting phage T7 exclusion